VLTGIAAGILIGHFYPSTGETMKPLGDGFIKLVKMLIAPIIFVTVVHGIASMGDLKKVGRVGLKALVYFEIVTTLALAIGLVVGNVLQPGAGMNIDAATIDTKGIENYIAKSKDQSTIGFVLDIIPNTFFSAFAEGNILQVLLIALLFAFALQSLGERGKPMLDLIEHIAQALFKMVGFVMRLAPIGAFGAMAFTIGKYGVEKLSSLALLMGAFYLTCLIFLFGVLGIIARLSGFSILRFIAYIKDELLIVLGTSSSESVLPRMIAKMKRLGCGESVVGLVIPAGYSFNLDGTCIYLTMATLFLAQATNTDLSIWQQLGVLGVLLVTSKGAAGVTGSGFITLAATLSSTGTIPVASIALILGIDRFMSEARALTNLVGNGVATIVISKS
jgi:aerobic C4-dicarboxylate transport protein